MWSVSCPSDRQPGDYYLAGGRLIPYKRVDLAVQAFNQLGLPLLIYGDGRDRASLQALAGPNVTFLGRVSSERLIDLYQHCRAFVFPGLEDFGIAPLEAQAAGRPVIAYGGGGALDTIIDGETGVLFAEQTVQSLIDAVRRCETAQFSPAACRRNAERFSLDRFRRELMNFVRNQIRATPQQNCMELRQYWAVIRRWWWIPVLTVVLVAVLTLVTQRALADQPAGLRDIPELQRRRATRESGRRRRELLHRAGQ